MTVELYERKTKHYFCGKKLLKFDDSISVQYTVLVVDLSEVYCGKVLSDGSLEKLFEERSLIPSKHRKGGQSASRFARMREGFITHWFKKLNDYLKPVDAPIHVVVNFVYKNRFFSHLSSENKEKIVVFGKCEYSGETGAYQYIRQVNG